MRRRTILASIGATVLAGCNTTNQGNTETETNKSPTPDLPENLGQVTQQPAPLPPIWTDGYSIQNHLAVLQVNPELDQFNISISDTGIEDSLQDQENTFGIAPKYLVDGGNTVLISSRGQTQELTVQKEEPGNHLLDLQSANQRDSPIFNTYSSHPDIGHDKITVDLQRLEEWHDNDYDNLKERNPEMETFVKSVGGNQAFSGATLDKVKKAKNDPSVILYQNGEIGGSPGHYQREKALNATSIGEFLDETHRLLFNIEGELDGGVISTEDEKYAAALQEAADTYLKDRENLPDVESHFWAFDLPRAPANTHGNGLIWDETNDELRILETVTGAYTASNHDPQLHPLIEDSNYLKEGHDAYQEWWHPLRFNGTKPEKGTLEFRDGKIYAAAMFSGIAGGFQDDDLKDIIPESGTALTTNYLVDIVDKLRNYNENGFDFNGIKNQAKVYDKLYSQDGNYIIGGTVENPLYAEVDSKEKINEIWEDPDGTLVDYIDELNQETYDQLVSD